MTLLRDDLTAGQATFEPLPPESPLRMPKQSLQDGPRTRPVPPTAPRMMAVRRVLLVGSTAALTAVAAYEMYRVLNVAGLTVPETVVLVLFVALFAWIALSFVNAAIGFLAMPFKADRTLDLDADEPLPRPTIRTALLLPTYNEDPRRVFSRVRAIWASLEATGCGERFEFFVLSDSTDPATWIGEEAEFLRLRESGHGDRIYYRHRRANVERKAGNIAEWVQRFGGRYDCMIVLDADSLMEGETIVRLAAAMERHPKVAIIQTVPVLLKAETLFARLQQFAGRVYGPLIARGFAWWHGADGNYWGHNAIIRVRAFAEHAGLPVLRGRKPFGGHIMSHDFVEAALLRRAGFAVHLATGLSGSYEESPPTLDDYALRDRRWCQGNLQHLAVLPARGLHWMSRLHLLIGIGNYATAPLWLLFLLSGILISLQAQYIRPEYFPSHATLFPQWPAQDPVRAAWVFAGTMALLVMPKLLGYLAMLPRRVTRLGMGGALRGFVSVILETIVSALIAPVMMLMQAKALFEIVTGRDSGWAPQRRNEHDIPLRRCLRRYAPATALGLALGLSAYLVSSALLIWMLPVVAGLVLCAPIAAWTSRSAWGKRLRRLGLLLTPEERWPPAVLSRADDGASESQDTTTHDPVMRLTLDRALRAAHIRMLPAPVPRRPGEIDCDLVLALAKIDAARDGREAVTLLTAAETFAVLADRAALDRLLSKLRRW